MKQKKSKNDSSISSSDNASVKIKSTAGVKESLVVAEDAVESPGTPFPIVGIGASAGGLEAFTVLLEHLPCDTGMAFVLIQHLSPSHKSMLTEILSTKTKMPVVEVTDGLSIAPDHVYIIPPDRYMSLSVDILHLQARASGPASKACRLIIFFLRLPRSKTTKPLP